MIGRVALVMAIYVAVGLLLVAPAMLPVSTGAVGGATAQASSTAPIIAPTSSTIYSTNGTTAAWDSGRLLDHSGLGAVPVAIEAPSIGVRAEVVETGLDESSGQMDIPERAGQVGWYRYGPVPGESGSAVLAGHVDMQGQGPGAFYELDRLAPGDEVTITMSDGSSQTFEVVETSRVAKTELDLEAIFQNSGPSRVTLVTCGGAFNHTDRTYLDNVVSVLRPRAFGT